MIDALYLNISLLTNPITWIILITLFIVFNNDKKEFN